MRLTSHADVVAALARPELAPTCAPGEPRAERPDLRRRVAALRLRELDSDLDGLLAGHVAGWPAAGLVALLRQRPRWVELCADPDLIANAGEELLRVSSPVPEVERRATAPLTLAGVDLPEGARVTLDLAAANHDATVFRSPARIEPTRRRARRHVAFGACPGAALARAELRILLEELTRTAPGLRLADELHGSRVVNAPG